MALTPHLLRYREISSSAAVRPKVEQSHLVNQSFQLAFALVDRKPQVDTSIDIHGLLLKEAEQRLPVLIEQKLRRLLR